MTAWWDKFAEEAPDAIRGWDVDEMSRLVLRLIEAGRDPADAQACGRSLRFLSDVDTGTLAAFSIYVAGLWTYWAASWTTPGAAHRARLARDHAAWHLARTPRSVE